MHDYRLIGRKLWRYHVRSDGSICGIGAIVHANIPANITTAADALEWVQAQEAKA